MLHHLGCEEGQGYWFSRAVPFPELERLMAKRETMGSLSEILGGVPGADTGMEEIKRHIASRIAR